MNKQEVLQKLNLPDAFEGFKPVEGTKLWGWNGDRAIFGQLIEQVKPTLIIEVGSWMGQSATTMAKVCAAKEMDTAVICVDTWLGSKEHWKEMDLRAHMELENGRPTFYRRFLTNMVQEGVDGRVVPLSMPSTIAASYLKDYGLQAEMVYVDGSHHERDVFNDLLFYWEITAPGGVLFGDDWPWDSVQDGVKAFCAEVGVPYSTHDINWIIRKPA